VSERIEVFFALIYIFLSSNSMNKIILFNNVIKKILANKKIFIFFKNQTSTIFYKISNLVLKRFWFFLPVQFE